MIRLAFGTALWAGTLALTAVSAAMIAMSWGIALPETFGFRGWPGTLAVPASTAGILIVRRHPHHAVGWALLGLGALAGVELFAQEYLAVSFFALPEPLPGAAVIGWLNVWIHAPAMAFLSAATLYFPDGRLASPRWRWVLGVLALGALAVSVGASADAGWMALWMRQVPPPYDPRDLGLLATYATPIVISGILAVSLGLVASGISLVRRFRRSTGTERQQIKWFALAATLAGIASTVNGVVMAWIGFGRYVTDAKLAFYVTLAAVVFLPVAVGIAILRHRLFDIDVLISRTLVYGTLSASLAASYAAAVIVLQAVLRPVTAGSDLAVAASTLLVVALFQPLRQRIQEAVDRRFYRSRYDAARTLDAFTARLRADVDLDSIRADLVQVLRETYSPAHASVWLRQAR